MAAVYWLIAFIIVVAVLYGRYWYHRPSGMQDMLTASLAHQTLEFMDWYIHRNKGKGQEGEDVPLYAIGKHLSDRQLSWRQKNDIIRYMKKAVWVYEDDTRGTKLYAISPSGEQKLETAGGLGLAVKDAAQKFDIESINSDQAKMTGAAIVAAAFRVHARSEPSENSTREKMAAEDIEEAVRTCDTDRIDRAINRASGIVTNASGVAPAIANILRLLGWWP